MPNFSAEDYYEFSQLVISANIKAVGSIEGTRQEPTPNYFIGEGKLAELRVAIDQHQASLVIFNHILSPAQERNLEKALGVRIIDRTELILIIFSERARSYEGKLQVELAQLEHLFTRLKRVWTHLDRQKGGVNLRGAGETQLESDRRLVKHQITRLQQKLNRVQKQRSQNRKARTKSATPTISLVGYTNAGKSTLFNTLTNAATYTADQLFATLDPTLKQLGIPGIGNTVLADTVGFIRDLPHSLIEAFKATLEETVHADLLLHVIDCSHAEKDLQQAAVNKVLQEIGATDIPQLLVFNKIDALAQPISPRIDYDANGKAHRVWISAKEKNGIDLLSQAITNLLSQNMVEGVLTLHPHQGKLRAKLYESLAIVSESCNEAGGITLNIRMEKQHYERLLQNHDITLKLPISLAS